MAQSGKQKDFSTRYNDKLHFLQTLYQERVSFLSTFKLPGLTLDDLEKEIQSLSSAGSSSDSSTSTSAGQATGGGYDAQTWNYFASLKFTPQAIAGVMGNIYQETGGTFDPKTLQGGRGPGTGIIQWEDRSKGGSGRWNELLKWAKANGKDEWALQTQLDWLWKEMQARHMSATSYGALTDVSDATSQFEKKIEAAGKPNMPNRIKQAQAYFDKWGKNGPPAGGTTTAKGDAGKVIAEATSWLSKPNVYWFGGGRTQADIAAGKFDCSSWVYHVFHQCGYEVCPFGGNTDSILGNSSLTKISSSQLQPGDIVFWNTYKSYGHVGIYLGNNRAIGDNGNTGTGKVSYIDMNNSYYKPRLEPQARRVKWNA
jgi:cell wall-associated NlpC family hydrolase